jgi:hypothetical protein
MFSLNLTFSAYNTISNITSGTLTWFLNENPTSNHTRSYPLNVIGNPLLTHNVVTSGITLTAISVGLYLTGGIAPGWVSAHNVYTDSYLYILSATDFYKPLQFINYPSYAWLGNTSKVTFLSCVSSQPLDYYQYRYFTDSYAPSAYNNTILNSVPFWVSANKAFFDEYIYQNQYSYTINNVNQPYSLISLDYNPDSPQNLFGIPISLIAYNNLFYPENINLTYYNEVPLSYLDGLDGPAIEPVVSNLTNALITEYYQITAITTNNQYTTAIYDNFYNSPLILNYNNIELNYTFYCNNSAISILNLTNGGKISVNQYINTIPLSAPAIIVGGTVTYFLSSRYWTVSSTVAAHMGVSSRYDLFNIKFGDPSIPYYCGLYGIEPVYLYAQENLIQQIPASTFDNYSGNILYPSNPNNWNAIDI